MGLADVKLITELTMTGLVAWWVFWTTRKTIPGMLETFRRELAEERQAIKELAAAVEKHSRILLVMMARLSNGSISALEQILDIPAPADCDELIAPKGGPNGKVPGKS